MSPGNANEEVWFFFLSPAFLIHSHNDGYLLYSQDRHVIWVLDRNVRQWYDYSIVDLFSTRHFPSCSCTEVLYYITLLVMSWQNFSRRDCCSKSFSKHGCNPRSQEKSKSMPYLTFLKYIVKYNVHSIRLRILGAYALCNILYLTIPDYYKWQQFMHLAGFFSNS